MNINDHFQINFILYTNSTNTYTVNCNMVGPILFLVPYVI